MGAAQAHLSLHLSKYHIVGNHMSQLISDFFHFLDITYGRYLRMQNIGHKCFYHNAHSYLYVFVLQGCLTKTTLAPLISKSSVPCGSM